MHVFVEDGKYEFDVGVHYLGELGSNREPLKFIKNKIDEQNFGKTLPKF